MDFSQRMNMAEAAAYLGRSKYWLSVNRLRLSIPSYLIGNQYFFMKEDLDSWILGQRNAEKANLRKGGRNLVPVAL
jgi:hypothetical protein